MTLSLAKTLAAVPKLNKDGQPVAFSVQGSTIVVTLSGSEATYHAVVTFDETTGSFVLTEKTQGKGKATLDTEPVRGRLVAFLVKHEWEPGVQPVESRWIVR